MSFFKPKEKDVVIETQEDLPKFHFDVNGFLMFDDQSLGGCGIYEVVPTIMTGAVTHREPLGRGDIDTKASGYSPHRAMEIVGDRRRDAVMQWVSFVNGLLPDDDAESQTHVQIILKKTHPDEWLDAYGYAIDSLHGHIGAPAPRLGRHGDAYRRSYEEMLQDLGDANANGISMWNGASYDVLGYIVVSYTPSSEGWWFDGRDDDYYVRDTPDEQPLFSVDGMAERIGKSIASRQERQAERNDYNAATTLFPIDEDRIAQVLQTRMRKIERKMSAYSQRVGNDALAFMIRRTHTIDNSMLVAFWDNPLTSYRYKVWNMRTSMSDVMMGMRNEEATASGDAAMLADAGVTDADMSSFLARFAGRDAIDASQDDTVATDGDGDVMPDDVSEAWRDIDPGLVTSSDVMLSDEDRFMQRYRRMSVSGIAPAIEGGTQGAGQDEPRDRHYENDNRLAGNMAYAQTTNTDSVQSEMRALESERRRQRAEAEGDKLRELGVSEREARDTQQATALDAAHGTDRRKGRTGVPKSIRDGAADTTGRDGDGGNPFAMAAERREEFGRQERASRSVRGQVPQSVQAQGDVRHADAESDGVSGNDDTTDIDVQVDVPSIDGGRHRRISP